MLQEHSAWGEMGTGEGVSKSGWEKAFMLRNVFVQLCLSAQRCPKIKSLDPPEQAPDQTPLRNDALRNEHEASGFMRTSADNAVELCTQLSFKTFLVPPDAQPCSSTRQPGIPNDLVFSAHLSQRSITPFPTPPPLSRRNNNSITCETSGTTSDTSLRTFTPRLPYFDTV